MENNRASEDRPAHPVVKPVADVPLREVTAGRGARTHVLIGEADGATNFAMRRFVMETGGGMPLHTNTVEHEQYVLKGRAKVGIGPEVFVVGPNTVLYIPEGVPHFYEVIEGPFEFLCMVPNKSDSIQIVESS